MNKHYFEWYRDQDIESTKEEIYLSIVETYFSVELTQVERGKM